VSSFVDQLERGGVAIDIGAGDAPYRPLFEAKAWRYIACDIDGDADVCIEPGGRIPLPRSSADVVLSFQVLEHVADLDAYLAECARLLKPDGHLLLSTHGNWPYHPHPTDYRRWTPMGLELELEQRGFHVWTLSHLIGPPGWMLNYVTLALDDVTRRRGAAARRLMRAVALVMNSLIFLADRWTPEQIRADNPSLLVAVASLKNRSRALHPSAVEERENGIVRSDAVSTIRRSIAVDPE
jgi:SAM-dependent methyltransferase